MILTVPVSVLSKIKAVLFKIRLAHDRWNVFIEYYMLPRCAYDATRFLHTMKGCLIIQLVLTVSLIIWCNIVEIIANLCTKNYLWKSNHNFVLNYLLYALQGLYFVYMHATHDSFCMQYKAFHMFCIPAAYICHIIST